MDILVGAVFQLTTKAFDPLGAKPMRKPHVTSPGTKIVLLNCPLLSE